MELHYDEIYNNDNFNNDNVLLEKKQNIEIFINENPIKNKKNGLSYENILTSLNMTVVDGKLQYINKNNTNIEPIKKQVQFNSNNNTNNKNNISNSINNVVIKELPRQISLTKEQYRKIILFNRIKKIQFQKYINNVKPKKMFFFNNNSNNNSEVSLLSNNNLNKLLFKF
jgi:hypothetical protein